MAIDEDVESCGSRAVLSSQAQPRHHRQKLEVYNEVLRRIQESNFEEANLPGFDDQLWLHFNRLPARYALDVNVERAEDVLAHKRLLQFAEDPANQPAFEVRSVQVYPAFNGNSVDSVQQKQAPGLTNPGPLRLFSALQSSANPSTLVFFLTRIPRLQPHPPLSLGLSLPPSAHQLTSRISNPDAMRGHDRINTCLPDELIVEVFRRLDSKPSRDACSLVCKRWLALERFSRNTLRISAIDTRIVVVDRQTSLSELIPLLLWYLFYPVPSSSLPPGPKPKTSKFPDINDR